jgi:hypothetical protein
MMRTLITDLQSGSLVKEIPVAAGQVRGLSFSADGRFAAAVVERQTSSVLTVFDVVRGAEVASRTGLHPRGLAVFSADGGFLASAQPRR